MDAVTGMHGPGPSNGTPIQIGAVLASASPLAVDLVAAQICGYRTEEVPLNVWGLAHHSQLHSWDDLQTDGPDWQTFVRPDFKRIGQVGIRNILVRFIIDRLPAIRQIGMAGDTIKMTLTERADSIRINGQDHATLKLAQNTDSISYVLQAEEPYARLTAYFPGGEVIYTNPFARYDASQADSPYNNEHQPLNRVLTVLWNLFLLACIAGTLYLLVSLYKRK